MKKVIYLGLRMPFIKASLLLLLSLNFSSNVQSQAIPPDTYLSTFTDPAGNYSVSTPSCFIVVFGNVTNSSNITNPQNVSTGTLTDFATQNFRLLDLSGICTNGVYSITANLNLGAGGLTAVPASPSTPYNAGFKIATSGIASASLTSSNFTIATYLNGVRKQSSTAIIGLDLLSSGAPNNISFSATEPFNQVAVEVSAGLLSLSLARSVNYYYAFASTSTLPILLPVKLTSFSAAVENKNVAVSWTTASEINVAKYELQRSNDGGITFNTVTTIAAKGSAAGETKYSYADGTTLSGNYTYRLKMIDKDGGEEYSKLVSVKLTTNTNWKVYPTLLTSGTDLNVSFATAGTAKTQVQLANLQGQVVRSVSTGANNKLTINTSGLSGGVYVLKLYKEGQLQTSEKVVIQ